MVVVAAAVVAFLVIAFLGRTMRRADFQYGGRNVPVVHNAMAIAAAFIGSAGFIGLAGAFFAAGSGPLAFVLGAIGGFLLLTVLVAPYFRSSGAATVPDLLAARFGGGLMRLLAPLVVVVCTFGLLVTEIAVGGRIASRAFGWSAETAVMVVTAVVLLTALAGGMRSLTMAAVAQCLIILVAFLLPLVVFSTTEFGMPIPQAVLGNALHRLADFPGGAAAALSAAAMRDPGLQAEDFGGLNFLLVVITLSAGIAALPHLVMRSAPAANVDGARRSSAVAFIFVTLVVVSAPAYSVFASLQILDTVAGRTPDAAPDWVYMLGKGGLVSVCSAPALSAAAATSACNASGHAGPLTGADIAVAGDTIVPAFSSIAGLPPIFAALLAVGAIAAALAAAGAMLFTVASALAHDLYVRFVDPHAPAGRRLIALRLVLIAVAAYAGWLAVDGAEVWQPLAAASLSIAAAGLFPSLVLGIWWRRCTSLGALSGMICGLAVTLFYFVLVEFDGERPWSFFGLSGTAVPGFASGAFGLAIGLLVTIIVSLATPAETTRYPAVDAIRRPNAAPLIQEDD
jgi:cation/acetate symporter